ncbi:MAG: hypothetical protein ACJA08_002219 [Cyclobacteriaceae bacterium]|jgi:hypothetical protein
MKKLFSILLLATLVSCGDESEPESFDSGFDYYPKSNRVERIYDVTAISFDLLGSETSNYQLKEYVFDSIITSSGLVTYVLKRETRTNESEVWESDSLWTFRFTDSQLILTENNVPYVKLTFPVYDGQTWDGNAYNSQSSQIYSLENISQSVPNVPLDTPMIKLVISDIPANLVSQDQRYEIYAKGIGLIEKNYIVLNFCTTNCDNIGQVQSGRILHERLLEYVEK